MYKGSINGAGENGNPGVVSGGTSGDGPTSPTPTSTPTPTTTPTPTPTLPDTPQVMTVMPVDPAAVTYMNPYVAGGHEGFDFGATSGARFFSIGQGVVT